MHAELSPSSQTAAHTWMPAAIGVAFLALLALAVGFAAFVFYSVDLRITMIVAVVTGVAATVAANAGSRDTARGAVWLGVWLALAFLLGGALQGFWSAAAITAPLFDAGFALVVALVNIRFAMIVSRA